MMGGSTTEKTSVPQYIEDYGKDILSMGKDLSQIGYTPYYGPDVAAFSPMQEQAFRNTGSMASAFGMGGGDMMSGIPEATEFAGGIRGYSSAPLYEQSVQTLQEKRPAQYDAIMSNFIDPVTGEGGRFGQRQEAEASSTPDVSRVQQAINGTLPVSQLTPAEYQQYVFAAANQLGR